jgi:cell filamentation protein, protein adenylyltransferase
VSRYSTGPQGEAQPGSRGRVLRNLRGITSVREMQLVETEALAIAAASAMETFALNHRFTADDIRILHEKWLGDIYEWAGEYRDVNLSRDGFMFASAVLVPQLMRQLEHGPLRKYTPCRFKDLDQQLDALAVTHAELVLIHPFREGNGRCARLLAALMALQAGLPALTFLSIQGRERQRYISAIHASVAGDYEPMRQVFLRVLRKS